MTARLITPIEDLYKTFATYPYKSGREGCPCCVSESDKKKICLKQLRDLTGEDLSRYTFKAITTWGDVEDFKHYLPRIFELMATTDFIVDTFVVLGKLKLAQWKNWPEKEQTAVREFLFVWWTASIEDKPYFDKEMMLEIYNITHDIERLLTLWEIDFTNCSFINYVNLVYDHFADLTTGCKDFKILDQTTLNQLLHFITLNSGKLTEGFYYFEEKDKELAQKISDTIYIFEVCSSQNIQSRSID